MKMCIRDSCYTVLSIHIRYTTIGSSFFLDINTYQRLVFVVNNSSSNLMLLA